MNGLRLAICDNDKTYCHRLDEYLRGHLNLAFDIFSFTDVDILREFAEKHPISLLMISESMYKCLEKGLVKDGFENIIVLDEGSGGVCEVSSDPGVHLEYISKYQAASKIVDGIIDFCAEAPEDFEGVSTHAKIGKSKIIGFYSPISKCGQTTLAVEMAKKLAASHKVIFLSFESFSPLQAMLGIQCDEDITDLLYYADCERPRFSLYLEKIRENCYGADFIMPARTATQVKDITYQSVKELIELLADSAGYEYVLLDLTEYPEGFFDILQLCDRIYTVTRQVMPDAERVRAYETVLRENGFSEIETKTVKCQLPDIRDRKSYDYFVGELLERYV